MPLFAWQHPFGLSRLETRRLAEARLRLGAVNGLGHDCVDNEVEVLHRHVNGRAQLGQCARRLTFSIRVAAQQAQFVALRQQRRQLALVQAIFAYIHQRAVALFAHGVGIDCGRSFCFAASQRDLDVFACELDLRFDFQRALGLTKSLNDSGNFLNKLSMRAQRSHRRCQRLPCSMRLTSRLQ